MKIALFITGLKIGGAEAQVTRMADAMHVRGHSVLLIYLTGEAEVLPDHREVTVIGLNAGKDVLTFVCAYKKARKLLSLYKPDVVHSHLFHANLFCRLLRVTLPMPRLICSSHSNHEKSTWRSFLYRLTDSLGDIFTNVSENAVAALVANNSVPSHKTRVLHNGIPLDRFSFSRDQRIRTRKIEGFSCDTPLFLAVGRLVSAKNYPLMFEAFTIVHRSLPNARLVVAGEGPLRSDLESLLKKLGMSSVISLLGVRYDIPNLLSAADVFVLSSDWEGFGLVIAEAMAARCIAVATDCGGTREVMSETGFLVPVSDTNSLAQAMISAYTMPEIEKKTFLDAAESRVYEKFSLDSAAERWLSCYTEGKAF